MDRILKFSVRFHWILAGIFLSSLACQEAPLTLGIGALKDSASNGATTTTLPGVADSSPVDPSPGLDAEPTPDLESLSYDLDAAIELAVQEDLVPTMPASDLQGYTYSVFPALPAGVNLNISSGQISGSPLESIPTTTYTITATNGLHTTSDSIQLRVTSEFLKTSSMKTLTSTLNGQQGWGSIEVIDGSIYFYGGAQAGWGAGQRKVSSAPTTNPLSWTSHGNILPNNFGWGSSYVDQNFGYLYGGVFSGSRIIYKFPRSNPLAITDTTLQTPDTFTGGCIFELTDKLLFIGGSATGDHIWTADYSAPDVITDTTARLPVGAGYTYCFKVKSELYFSIISNYTISTYRAQENLPYVWSLHSSHSVLEAATNGGSSMIVGEYAYIFNGNLSVGMNMFRTRIKDFSTWERVAKKNLMYTWGKNAVRIDDKVYFFGGNRYNYLGSNLIGTMDIVADEPEPNNSSSGQLPIAIGQSSINAEASSAPVSGANLGDYYYAIHYDGTRLYAADNSRNRVLIWNSLPTSSGQVADIVLGQSSMTAHLCNQGNAAPSASTLCEPGGVFVDGTKLFVADYKNNRVLIWNTLPTVNGAPADVVLGQTLMTDAAVNQGGISASTFYRPWALTVVAGKLIVGDMYNHRVLIWNSIPTTNKTAANTVLGQTAMNVASDGSSGPTAAKLSYPNGLCTDGTKLVVADSSNNRILVWNSIPTANTTPANFVAGQANMTSNTSGTTAQKMIFPTDVSCSTGKLYVNDFGGNRTLVWNSIPIADNLAADNVFGQPDFTSTMPNLGVGVSGTSLGYSPMGLYSDSQRVIIGDPDNSRFLMVSPF